MRTEQIVYLLEISRQNSINLASQNLNISVQALAKSIKNLEAELGFSILDSSHRGTVLTESGKFLLEAGLEFIGKINTLQLQNKEFFIMKGSYDFYCVEGIMEFLMPQFMVEFSRHHVAASINPVVISFLDVEEKLLDGTYEYCFVLQPVIRGKILNAQSDKFEFVRLKKLDFVCQVNKKQSLAQQKYTTLSAMLKYDIIAYEPCYEHTFSVKNIFQEINPQKKIRQIAHRKLYERILLEEKVVSLGVKCDNNLLQSNNIAEIPITDDVYVNLGYLRLKHKKLSANSELMVSKFTEFLNSQKC